MSSFSKKYLKKSNILFPLENFSQIDDKIKIIDHKVIKTKIIKVIDNTTNNDYKRRGIISKGDLGIKINLNLIPCRENNMNPYEIMLSESQERMLIVLKKGKEKEARKIFEKWGLDFAIIGKLTNSKKLELEFNKKSA